MGNRRVRPPLAVLSRFVPHLGRLGRAERWRRHRNRPRIWAHRGDSAHAPENTLEAFDLARQAGADGIELDVRLDADGNVVVFHDADLERLCGRTGCIEQTSATERKALRVQGSAAIPTLGEVFDVIGDLEVNVEIKSNQLGRNGALVEATANVIRQLPRSERILISSFDPVTLVQFYRLLPEVTLAYLFGDEQAFPIRKGWVGRAMGAAVLHPQHTLCTEASVKLWHTQGRPINTWTVDDADELVRLAALGVDGIFTNDPAGALRVLGS